ncbi:MAG: trehalase family glycosidase [bacterium]
MDALRRFFHHTVHGFVFLAVIVTGCENISTPPLSRLKVSVDSPLYTTYAATKERSRFVLDEGYHFRFYDRDSPVEFTTDSAGEWGLAVSDGDREAVTLKQWNEAPLITLSYPDMMEWKGRPLSDLEISGTFVVHSSQLAMQEISLRNLTRFPRTVKLLLYLRYEKDVFQKIRFEPGGMTMQHEESPDLWTLEHDVPAVSPVHDLVLANPGFISRPATLTAQDGTADALSVLLHSVADKGLEERISARTVALLLDIEMLPMARRQVRIVRGVAATESERHELRGKARMLLASDFAQMQRNDEELFRRVPPLKSNDKNLQLLYWSCWAMMRQVMLPPEADAPVNYYVFSREPSWGWGHGGQVFHESLTMMAYALMDPAGAMDSQRFFAMRQDTDGYIPYRIGPYLNETIETNGQRTTSAPWYAWTNWEVYRITHDRPFLEQMYASSKRLYRWYTAHRDRDGDGLCEWGGNAVLESVRDARVAVWDEVADPTEVEALDLNCILVMEAKSLAEMARELGLFNDAADFRMEAEARAEKIRDTMWDEETGFFYHVSLNHHNFSVHRPDDLKRKEIIGFLPLWAGIASEQQAARLIGEHLTNRNEFWRQYGVPSLSADDPFYNPKGYWNGPVWVEWNYLIQRGLFNYGYDDDARELAHRVARGMIQVLRETHTLWEFYSPDEAWGGWHTTYVWAGLVNRMLLDASSPPTALR